MKVVAYSIKASDKEYLAKANQKKHDITLIANPLDMATVAYAAGKDAVLVFSDDAISSPVIAQLAALNVRFMVTGTEGTGHIDTAIVARHGIKLSNVRPGSAQEIADETIRNLDLYQQNKCLGDACVCSRACRANFIPQEISK